MVKSNAKNMDRKPGEENKFSKVVGGIQYEEQQKNRCNKLDKILQIHHNLIGSLF